MHQNVWFTADTHFGHRKVIEFCNRPFTDVDEMDAELIRRWNVLVTPADVVYHLGDLSFHRPDRTAEILTQLRGQKFLVVGNHDAKRLRPCVADHFIKTSPLLEISIADDDGPHGKQKIVLCHFAMRVWNRSHHGAWHLHGHSHGSLPDIPHARALYVGSDCWSYAPVSYAEIKARMAQKTWAPIDHHGNGRDK